MSNSSGTGLFLGMLGSINSELFGQALASALSQYRLWDPSFAIARDLEAYEKLNRDPVASHAFYLRKLGAAGTRYSIVPTAPSHLAGAAAKLTEAAVGELDDFLALRFNLGEGIIAGSRWARVWWETRRVTLPEGVTLRSGKAAREVELVCPVVHRDVDKRRFRQYRVTRPDREQTPEGVGEDGELRFPERVVEFPWQVWRPVQRVWQDKDKVEDDGGTWIHHTVDDTENSLGYGNGVADPLFTSVWARGQIVQYMLAGLERWAQGGIAVAEAQTIIAGELSGARYENAKAEYQKVLKKAMRDSVVVVPQGDKVSIMAPSEAWLNECITALRYFDGIITQRVLMSVLPSGGGEGGSSLARAQEEGGTQMRVTLHDRARIQDTLDRDVLKVFWARNRETLSLLQIAGQSLDSARPGTLRLGSDGARESLAAAKDLCEIVKIAPVRSDEFYDRLGLTPPRPEDKVVYLPVEQAKADKLEGQADEEEAKASGIDDEHGKPSDPDEAQRRREESRAFAAFLDIAGIEYGLGSWLRGEGWSEEKHPRDDHGRFGQGHGGESSAKAPEKRTETFGEREKRWKENPNQESRERKAKARSDAKGEKSGRRQARREKKSDDASKKKEAAWQRELANDPRVQKAREAFDRVKDKGGSQEHGDALRELADALDDAEARFDKRGEHAAYDDVERTSEDRQEQAYVAAALKAGLLEFAPADALEFAARSATGRGWNLVYTWVCKCDTSSCKGCEYLGKGGEYTWSTLPTFPGTGDTQCGGRCRCILRARPATKDEHAKIGRRLGSGERLERIEKVSGYEPPTLRTIRETTG